MQVDIVERRRSIPGARCGGLHARWRCAYFGEDGERRRWMRPPRERWPAVFEVEVGVVEVDRGIGELARFELGEALSEPGEESGVGHVGDGSRTSVRLRRRGVWWG